MRRGGNPPNPDVKIREFQIGSDLKYPIPSPCHGQGQLPQSPGFVSENISVLQLILPFNWIFAPESPTGIFFIQNPHREFLHPNFQPEFFCSQTSSWNFFCIQAPNWNFLQPNSDSFSLPPQNFPINFCSFLNFALSPHPPPNSAGASGAASPARSRIPPLLPAGNRPSFQLWGFVSQNIFQTRRLSSPALKFGNCHHRFFHPLDERATTTPLGSRNPAGRGADIPGFWERLDAAAPASPNPVRENPWEENPDYFRHSPNLQVQVGPGGRFPLPGKLGAFYSVGAGVVPAHRGESAAGK